MGYSLSHVKFFVLSVFDYIGIDLNFIIYLLVFYFATQLVG
jgi:hypothetical protein